jgi:hypothetical protein
VSEGPEPSLSFNLVTAASFCEDVVLWKMVSAGKGLQAVLTVLLFPWGLQLPAEILYPSVLLASL